MSALPLVMGLLLLAYLGTFVVGGKESFAASSNVGWIVLGLVLGPYALNVIGETLLDAVTPVLTIAAGWVAFATGVRTFGVVTSAPWRGAGLGIAAGMLTALVAGGITWLGAPVFFPSFASEPGPRIAFALTAAAIVSGSGRVGAAV